MAEDAEILERWQRQARGWSARADEIRDFGMPVSVWMIDQLALQPGQRELELQWIDLETATVDAVLCRWGLMFAPDPGASLQEIRRVLRPGGRVALAVWAEPERNPWATIPTRAL